MTAINFRTDLKPTDRRAAARARCFKSGKLQYGGFSPTVIDCLVVDMTPEGARVETGTMVRVPEIFALVLNDNVQRRARRCWAMGNQVGLEFLPAAA